MARWHQPQQPPPQHPPPDGAVTEADAGPDAAETPVTATADQMRAVSLCPAGHVVAVDVDSCMLRWTSKDESHVRQRYAYEGMPPA